MENMLFGLIKNNPKLQKFVTILEAAKRILPPNLSVTIIKEFKTDYLVVISDSKDDWFIEWLYDLLPSEFCAEFCPIYREGEKKAAVLVPLREEA